MTKILNSLKFLDPRPFDNKEFKAENILFLKNVRPLRVRQQYLVFVTLPESIIIDHEVDTPEARGYSDTLLCCFMMLKLMYQKLLSCG